MIGKCLLSPRLLSVVYSLRQPVLMDQYEILINTFIVLFDSCIFNFEICMLGALCLFICLLNQFLIGLFPFTLISSPGTRFLMYKKQRDNVSSIVHFISTVWLLCCAEASSYNLSQLPILTINFDQLKLYSEGH